MKLHLPKSLLTAVLAACVAPAAWGLTCTTSYRDVVIDTSSTYEGVLLNYSNGTLTYSTPPSIVDITFTLDYDAFDNLTTGVSLLLADKTDNNGDWGLWATADAQVKGNNMGSIYTHGEDTIMSAADLLTYVTTETVGEGDAATTKRYIKDLNVVIDGTAADKTGTRLQTSNDTDVYYSYKLRYTTATFSGVSINKTLITSMTVSDAASITYTNTNNTWTKTFDADKVTNVTTGQVTLTGGDSGTAKDQSTPIVVGGAGQLKLETWRKGNVLVDDDIYLAGSTHGDVANYGVIRISNDDTSDHYTTEFSGNIYLVEDSSIKGTGSEAITFNGTITDKNVPANNDATANGDYTLTLGGGGITVSGKLDVGGLAVVQGYDSADKYFAGEVTISSSDAQVARLEVGTNAKLTIAEGGSLKIGSTIKNSGSLVINGTIALRNDDLSGFDSTVYSTGGDTNGLSSYGHLYHLVSGTGTLSGSTAQITYDGNTYNIAEGIKIEEGSAYVVATDTVLVGGDNAAADTKGAGKFIVLDGATLQLNAREADAALSADALITTTEGEGIIDLRTTATIAKNTVTKFDGTLKVSEGGILQVCQTDYKGPGEGYSEAPSGSANLSSLKAIELAGGELRHASASMSLGNIKVTADSKLNVFDIESSSTVITIDSLDLGAELDVVGRWKSNTVITTLSGSGTLDVAAPAESGESKILTIKATNNFTGKINQTGGTIRSTAGITVGNITKTGGTLELVGESSVTQGMSVDSISKTGGKLVLGVDGGGDTTKSFSIGTISGNQGLQLHEGSVTLGSTTATTQALEHLDVSAGGDSVAQVTLKSGATVTATNGNMWLSRSAAIKLENTASLKMGAVTIKGNNASGNGSIQRNDESPDANGADKYSSDSVRFNISNAAVDVAAAANGTTISNRLLGVALTNTGTGTLTATNGYNNYTGILAESGNIHVKGYNAESAQGELSALTIGANLIVGVHDSWADININTTTNKATVAVAANGTATFGQGATLYANLTMANGSTLVSVGEGGLNLGTGTLTFGGKIKLGDGFGEKLQALTAGTLDTLVLFTNVSDLQLTLNDATVEAALLSARNSGTTSVTTADASAVIAGIAADQYTINFAQNQVFLSAMPVPEPTTSMLGLVGLVALTFRRRRK